MLPKRLKGEQKLKIRIVSLVFLKICILIESIAQILISLLDKIAKLKLYANIGFWVKNSILHFRLTELMLMKNCCFMHSSCVHK